MPRCDSLALAVRRCGPHHSAGLPALGAQSALELADSHIYGGDSVGFSLVCTVWRCISRGVGLLVIGLTRVYPNAFLWLLGAKYAGLRFEFFKVMISSSMRLVSGVMNSVNVARRFNYHWDYAAGNVVTLILQIIFIWKADLSGVRNVLWHRIFSGAPSLMMFVIAAVYGFVCGPRRIPGAGGLSKSFRGGPGIERDEGNAPGVGLQPDVCYWLTSAGELQWA